MSKNILTLSLFLIFGCSPKIPKVEILKIEEAYQKISFSPETLDKEIDANFKISITPIDAKEMNKIAFESTSFDGNYEKEVSIATLIDEQLSLPNLSKSERRKLEMRKQIVEFVSSKINTGEIPKDAGQKLIWKLWNKEKGIDGTESNIGRGYSGIYNPYKVNKKYLSVFKLTFQNNSSSVKKVKSKELLFNSGYEQLYPFETKYFENIYENNQDKLRIIYRLNLPNELIIPPKETVIKYVSIPSINPTTKNLAIKLIQNDKVQNFEYSVKIDGQSQTNILEKYVFKADKDYQLKTKRYYFVLATEDKQTYVIRNNSLFLPQEIQKDKLNIYGIMTMEGGFSFIKKQNFMLNESSYNQVKIEYKGKEKYKK